jgi:hypothetical protein
VTPMSAVASLFSAATPVLAETLYCSVWQGRPQLSGAGGHASTEPWWQGMTNGRGNQGDRWKSARWRTSTSPRSSGLIADQLDAAAPHARGAFLLVITLLALAVCRCAAAQLDRLVQMARKNR